MRRLAEVVVFRLYVERRVVLSKSLLTLPEDPANNQDTGVDTATCAVRQAILGKLQPELSSWWQVPATLDHPMIYRERGSGSSGGTGGSGGGGGSGCGVGSGGAGAGGAGSGAGGAVNSVMVAGLPTLT